MAAIKAFFDRNRAYNMRSATVAPFEEPEVVVVKNPFQEKIDHYDAVLERDWFLDYDSLMDFIGAAEPEVFHHVYLNRQRYPDRVQGAFKDAMMTAYHFPTLTNPVVHDLTDEAFFKLEQAADLAEKQKFDTAWNRYKTSKGLNRGVSNEEEDLHVLDMMLRKEKEALDDYRRKVKRVYVPPSRLKNSEPAKPDANESKMLKKVDTLENEIKTLQKRITELDNRWEQTHRDEFAKQYYAML